MLMGPQPLCSLLFLLRLSTSTFSPLITMRPSTVAYALLALAVSPTLAAPIVQVRSDTGTTPDKDDSSTMCGTPPAKANLPANLASLGRIGIQEPFSQYQLTGIGPAMSSGSIGPAVLPNARSDDPSKDSEIQKRDYADGDLLALLQALNRRSDNVK